MSESEARNYVGEYGARKIVLRDGKLFCVWGRSDDAMVKIGVNRFRIPRPGSDRGTEIVLIPGTDGSFEYLHMEGRAVKRTV